MAEFYVTIMGLSVPTFEETGDVSDTEASLAEDEVKSVIKEAIREQSWQAASISIHREDDLER